MSAIVELPHAVLRQVADEVRAAAWFAGLGEPLTGGERDEAVAYAAALGLGALAIESVADWPAAEQRLQAPDWSPAWWEREESLRRGLLARAESHYPPAALWTALTTLTTEAGDLVHGKAAAAAARLGSARPASIHVAAGAAAQAAYQFAVARLADEPASLFESKFQLFAAGHWPLGVGGSTLFLF
ncbi:MAG: hypothetical protein U1E23_02965 [Reyranellaceae bacterium]